MKLVFIPLAFCALSFSGCLSITKAQLENKIPRVNAQELTVKASSIWGVSGTLTEKDVKWTGNVKALGSSEGRVTSPIGTVEWIIKGASAVEPSK